MNHYQLLRKLENIEGELVNALCCVEENGDKRVVDALNKVYQVLLDAELVVCEVGNIK